MKTNRREFLSIAGATALAAGTSSASIASASTKTKLPGEATTELFLDNVMLEATPGVTRRLHPPQKHLLNPVVRCERWCDGVLIEPYTTMYDDDEKLFKMWARADSDWQTGPVDGNAAYMLYFTSTDGVRWDKPDLGVIDVAGRRDHNIVFTSDMVPKSPTRFSYGAEKYVVPTKPMVPQGKKAFFWSVNKHPHPRDESENYVALAIVQDHRRGAHIVTSPDGIHWSCAASPFWQTPHDVAGNGDDCLMHLMYDDAKEKWVIYRRIIPQFSERMIANEADCTRPGIDRYNRSYAYAESDDLREWTGHTFILAMDADDPADTELYQFATHKIGETYVGYMSVFYTRHPSPINVHLATSRDGVNFTRVSRGEPFVAHGPLGYYDFMAMACSQPQPIVVDDTVYFYYAALNFPHDVHVTSAEMTGGPALATFKRDRYASLETCPLRTGPSRILTKPFKVEHPKLFVNAATWNNGSIRVEALTPDWQPIAGFTEGEAKTIQGDALNHPVRWNGNADVSQLVGQEIRLKFYLTRARVHAMTLANTARPLAEVEPAYRYDPLGDTTPKLN